MQIQDDNRLTKIASKPSGPYLYRNQCGFFFESPLRLDGTLLSDEADNSLRDSGKLRQVYLCKQSLNDFVLGDNFQLIEDLISLMQPAVIRLWLHDQLRFCD